MERIRSHLSPFAKQSNFLRYCPRVFCHWKSLLNLMVELHFNGNSLTADPLSCP